MPRRGRAAAALATALGVLVAAAWAPAGASAQTCPNDKCAAGKYRSGAGCGWYLQKDAPTKKDAAKCPGGHDPGRELCNGAATSLAPTLKAEFKERGTQGWPHLPVGCSKKQGTASVYWNVDPAGKTSTTYQLVCGTAQGSVANTAYKCNACKDAKCGTGKYRSGKCSGTTNGYACKAQPKCKTSEYVPACDRRRCPNPCPSATRRALPRARALCRVREKNAQNPRLQGATPRANLASKLTHVHLPRRHPGYPSTHALLRLRARAALQSHPQILPPPPPRRANARRTHR